MKTINKIKPAVTFSLFFFVFAFSSCTKKSIDTAITDKKEAIETVKLSENDFNESDEEIFTVDYKEFYEDLNQSGEWIQVNEEDLGLNLEKGTASGEFEIQKDLLSKISPVNNAYAADVSEPGMFFVWKPSSYLAVSANADVPAVYVPYYNGQWVNTDAGWYFKAPTPAEEIVHHYGRWVNTSASGWVWVPGRVWSPAWVDWKENNDYISWTPLSPGEYIVNNIMSAATSDIDNYFTVERKFFMEPLVYNYRVINNPEIIREMVRPEGIIIVNNTIINRGPDVVYFQKNYNTGFEQVK
ncbi:MAG: hypothetical protein LH629_00240, partial [Ignavibacteria bacterium]|nr:hypothetical protein [Ignavibacteria bacterium]